MPEISTADKLREARQRINTWTVNNPPSRMRSAPLDLSGIGLTTQEFKSLTPELTSLNNLAILNLGNNNITALPPEIGQFNNLVGPMAENNQISSISPEIAQLSNLQALRLNNNQLTDLIPEMGQLKSLVLLELDHNNIQNLIPEIGQMDSLETLGLNNNQINAIPPEIAQLSSLAALGINDNNLVAIPPEIGRLDSLQTLVADDNRITSLPAELGQLDNLQILGFQNNQISTIPPQLEQLANLQSLDLTRNPLSQESLDQLQNNFRQDGTLEIFVETNNTEKLRGLYPNKSPEEIQRMDSQIGNLKKERPKFIDGNDQKPSMLAGDLVVDTFLSHVKPDHGGPDLTQHYHGAAANLLERAIGTDVQDSEASLTQIASSLGNCPTPVSDLMEKTGVQLAIESGNPLNGTLKTMLQRQAFEELVKKERIVPNSHAERIEAIQGLVNTVFLQDANLNQYNSLVIDGNNEHIASKTRNIDFAFSQITDNMKEKFAKLCCETDRNNKPITNNQGNYTLDADKFFTITESYIEKQGILDAKAQARKVHINELKELMNKPYNRDLAVDFELVDFQKVEDNLRLQMRGLPDDKIGEAIEKSLVAYKAQMEQVRKDYGLPSPPPEVVQNTNTAQQAAGATQNIPPATGLEAMTVPGNRNRSNSLDNRRNRSDNNTNNTARRRGRSL